MEKHIPEEQISALVDGQLADREAGIVQAHLTECGACHALYEDLSEVTHLFQSAATIEPPPFLWQRISAEIQPSSVSASKGWLDWFGHNRPVWVATSLVIVLLGAFVFTAEFRSRQLARQEALNKIETMRLAWNGQNPETDNPFHRLLSANQRANPFSTKRLSVESNPFRSVAAR